MSSFSKRPSPGRSRPPLDPGPSEPRPNPQPGDEIALLSYSLTRGLAVNEYFTSDLSKIWEALGKVLDTPGGSRGWDYSFDPDHDVVGMELMSTQVYRELPGSLRSNLQANGRIFADHMRILAKALRLIPGQKNGEYHVVKVEVMKPGSCRSGPWDLRSWTRTAGCGCRHSNGKQKNRHMTFSARTGFTKRRPLLRPTPENFSRSSSRPVGSIP